jgi:hypothetical protein
MLELLPEALERVRPLNAAQRRALPEDAARLSRVLTTERTALRRPYWASPPLVSAYLYYFLPWNLLRLTRLLSGLSLPAPESPALFADVGSGPLTLPLALWLARPDLDGAPPFVLALDSAPQPLELGKKLFGAWAALAGRPVWPLRLERASLAGIAHSPALLVTNRSGRALPWLMTAGNLLNEVPLPVFDPDGGKSGAGWENRESRDGPGLLLRAFEFFARVRESGRSVPLLLCVEPGTRLGGKTVTRLRGAALAGGLAVCSPCPGAGACPLLRDKSRAWCHFTFDCSGSPQWLERLSAQAGLHKNSLSLSFLLLRSSEAGRRDDGPGRPARGAKDAGRVGKKGGTVAARVISSSFAVPGLAGKARYACCACGLLVLEDAESLAQGSFLRLSLKEDLARDAKSGALVIPAPIPVC